MARVKKVTCAVTKEKGTEDTFYKAPDDKWYKSKEIYEEYKFQTDCWKEILRRFEVYLDYEKGQPFPTLLTRKLKELKFYTNEVILETIKENEKSILWAIENKNFSSSQNKIFYIFAILSNNIADVNKRIKNERKAKPKKEIMSVVDIEIVSNPEVKDLSNWLNEEDDLWN